MSLATRKQAYEEALFIADRLADLGLAVTAFGERSDGAEIWFATVDRWGLNRLTVVAWNRPLADIAADLRALYSAGGGAP